MEKALCVFSDTEGELTPRYHLVFAALFRVGLRILSYPLRCIGRPRLSYSRKGFSLLLRRVFRKEDSGRLSPAGGSLNGLAFPLLDLLHRTDRILCKPVSVKMMNTERTIMNCEL